MLPRLYPILDVPLLEQRGIPVKEAAEAMLAAGVTILQWRSKAAPTRASCQQAQQLAGMCRQRGVTFIVNDRADLALVLQAGLHVGQEDLPASVARQLIGSGPLLGLSTHNARQLEESEREPVDYVALGPIFQTASKENPDPVVGVDQLRQWRQLTGRTLVAIGGITMENAAEVFDAGADAVAVIGDLIPPRANKETIQRRMERWLTLVPR